MAQTGIDETLKLEAVYLTSPIPRNAAVLTVLGAVFDKVYFPGVHMPKSGYDPKDVKKEIVRLEGLNDRQHDTQLLIAAMKMVLHAKTLEGFCEFTGDPEDVFLQKNPVPGELVRAVYDVIRGPPRPGFTPMFQTNNAKGLGDNYSEHARHALENLAARGRRFLRQEVLCGVDACPRTGATDNVAGDRARRRVLVGPGHGIQRST